VPDPPPTGAAAAPEPPPFPSPPRPPQRRAYRITSWEDSHDFLTQLARASGKLLKGGDADLNTAARMVLYDWQRGKIPFYTLPPGYTDEAPPKPGAAAAGKPVEEQQQQQQQEAQQQQQEEGDGGSGMYAEGVTEEDAAAEAGARPESASAAARAMREAAAAALAAQRRGRIPIKEGYYMPNDEHAGEGEDGGSEPEGSDAGLGSGSEEEDDAEDGAGSEDEEASASGSEEVEEEEAGGGGAAGAGSGDESDGYGEEGLSWEAVLQAVQVGGRAFRVGTGFEWGRQPSCCTALLLACLSPCCSGAVGVLPLLLRALPCRCVVLRPPPPSGNDAHVSFGVEASLTNTKSRADNPYHYP
jgi:hypothetical protein